MFYVLECLKDLIRFLRVDDATCEIRRQLGRSQAVEKVLFHAWHTPNIPAHSITALNIPAHSITTLNILAYSVPTFS